MANTASFWLIQWNSLKSKSRWLVASAVAKPLKKLWREKSCSGLEVYRLDNAITFVNPYARQNILDSKHVVCVIVLHCTFPKQIKIKAKYLNHTY